MIQEWIRNMFWWIPTKEEQFAYRLNLKKDWEKEIPSIVFELSETQKIYDNLMNELEFSLSQSQMKIYMDAKVIGNKLVFLNTRLRHHQEEIIKPILQS